MGRPTLLTPALADRIVDAVTAGASREGAARCAGITRRCLQEWIARGRDGDEPYVHFVHRIEEAEGDLEVEIVEHLKAQSRDGKTPATMALLSRLNPAVWAAKSAVTVEQVESGTIQSESDLEIARSVVAAIESRKKPEAA